MWWERLVSTNNLISRELVFIDVAVLVDALDQGLIPGAGLDVFEEEPEIPSWIGENRKRNAVAAHGHMNTWTQETQEKMEVWVIDNIRRALTGKGLISMIPEQKDAGLDKA